MKAFPLGRVLAFPDALLRPCRAASASRRRGSVRPAARSVTRSRCAGAGRPDRRLDRRPILSANFTSHEGRKRTNRKGNLPTGTSGTCQHRYPPLLASIAFRSRQRQCGVALTGQKAHLGSKPLEIWQMWGSTASRMVQGNELQIRRDGEAAFDAVRPQWAAHPLDDEIQK